MKVVAITDDKKVVVLPFWDIDPSWTVCGEICMAQTDDEDPPVHPRRPIVSIYDPNWPHNMFLEEPVPLSEFKKQIESVIRLSAANA
jgi:hypothetical protein